MPGKMNTLSRIVMDSQELTGGNAVRQTGKVAMKKKNPCLIFEAGTNNKGAIPVTGRNRRLASPSGNVQGIGGN